MIIGFQNCPRWTVQSRKIQIPNFIYLRYFRIPVAFFFILRHDKFNYIHHISPVDCLFTPNMPLCLTRLKLVFLEKVQYFSLLLYISSCTWVWTTKFWYYKTKQKNYIRGQQPQILIYLFCLVKLCIVTVLWREEGSTVKYSLSTRAIPRRSPRDCPRA